ncbi:hypothetical protein AFLA_007622 [Aspergillus flavus NRRL3357]|nr:hypothetical protein AFLA_007622 [Aspergillus flavus NRRL3357]
MRKHPPDKRASTTDCLGDAVLAPQRYVTIVNQCTWNVEYIPKPIEYYRPNYFQDVLATVHVEPSRMESTANRTFNGK